MFFLVIKPTYAFFRNRPPCAREDACQDACRDACEDACQDTRQDAYRDTR